MATKFTNGTRIFYAGGTAGASNVVGYESNRTRVFCMPFTTLEAGASHISFSFGYHSKKGNTGAAPIRFYIGTDPNSHKNAGQEAEYHGEVTFTYQSSGQYPGYIASGEVDIVLLPNTTYYLWIFPGSTNSVWYEWYITLQDIYGDGGAGVIRIKERDGEIVIVPTVKENGEFVTLAATVKNNEEFSFFG